MTGRETWGAKRQGERERERERNRRGGRQTDRESDREALIDTCTPLLCSDLL